MVAQLARKRFLALAEFLAALVAMACSDSGSGGPGLGKAGCLSDQQICALHKGVTTQSQVQSTLGNAQEYLGSSTWVYVCQQIAGQQVVHNDQVIVDFDSSEHVSDVVVLRQGVGSTPPPDCASSGGAAGGSASSSGCASVPRPKPDSTAC